MKLVKTLLLACLVIPGTALAASADTVDHGRQYYTGWSDSGTGYLFAVHRFKPEPGASDYSRNYVIWYRSTK
jgi:hypothetical protein